MSSEIFISHHFLMLWLQRKSYIFYLYFRLSSYLSRTMPKCKKYLRKNSFINAMPDFLKALFLKCRQFFCACKVIFFRLNSLPGTYSCL